MKEHQDDTGSRFDEIQQFELFFANIVQRQQIEQEYYRSRNQILLPEIEKARERIREAMKQMGFE